MKREQATVLNRVFKEGLIRQVTFEQRHKGNRDPATQIREEHSQEEAHVMNDEDYCRRQGTIVNIL